LLHWHNDISGRRCLFTELRHRDDASSLQPALASAGFEHEQELNFLIDVSGGPDAVWDRFDRSACKNVRRAERDGLHVEEVNTAEGVSECYDLLRQVYAAVDIPLADISLFQASLDVLQPLGMVRMMLARSPEGLAGARAVLLYKDRVFDWYAGADREMRDSRPNDFLVWRTLEWAATHGYGLFDFGGAGHPDVPYGVRDFKAKFGGQLVNHGRVRCVHAPRLLRLSEAAYALLRRVL
jgi:serine/alanine adding enzyme